VEDLEPADGEPDLPHQTYDPDEADREPSLGATDADDQNRAWAYEWVWGREDLEGDDADDEPSLGSIGVTAAFVPSTERAATFDQRRWACGSDDDREL